MKCYKKYGGGNICTICGMNANKIEELLEALKEHKINIREICDKRDREIAKILKNTVLNCIDGKRSPAPYKMLKDLIEALN